ncbi:MAG TPA: SRPBCC family protein [Herpetosiphonaceae bacterium]
MANLQLTQAPVAATGMLIRKPIAEVFEAIVNPELTTRFWFTKSSGRLEAGAQVTWEWEMYGASALVTVTAFEPRRRIAIEWPGYSGLTAVEWRFLPHEGGTFVSVTESGFVGDGDSLLRQTADSTQGFSLMLAGMKAYLEHGVELNLVADRYPAGLDAAH